MFRPLPQGPKRVSASKAYTGKVFSVEMPYQHVHQAFPGRGVQHQGSGQVQLAYMVVPVPQIVEELVERPEILIVSLNVLGCLSLGTEGRGGG